MEQKKLINIIKKEIDDSHYYWLNDEFVPGVTSIIDEGGPTSYGLKQFFLNNSQESASEISKKALSFGSDMHDAYERLLNGIELNLKNNYQSRDAKRHLSSFAQWFQDYQPKNIQTEQIVGSLEYKFAGTLDCFCVISGETWLIDFKTSAGIYWNYEIQVAAYKQAFEEMEKGKVQHMAILRTGTRHKSGYEFKETTRTIEEFMNIYRTYLSLHDGKIPEPPMMDIYPETLKLEINQEIK